MFPITTVPAGIRHPEGSYNVSNKWWENELDNFTIINIVFDHSVRESWGRGNVRNQEMKVEIWNIPNGETGCHLISSFMVAFK